MNVNSSRRNGKPASCEPCRLNKTKCDHGHPKCDRCRQRGIEDRCFYHPAPLTRLRTIADDSATDQVRPPKRKRPSQQIPDSGPAFSETSPTQGDKLADAVAADVYHPGFLGPGSYAVLLPQEEGAGEPREREESVASERSDRELTHQHTLSKSMRYRLASDVLSTLGHYNSIKELVLWYCRYNEGGIVPAQIQVDAINALEYVVDKHDLRRKPPSTQLIEQVLETTSRPFTISQSLEACDFHILCSGENVRFEMIGFLLATAGRSLTFGSAPDSLKDPDNKDMKMRFTDELLRASTKCLFLTTMLATVNDVTVWMYDENFLFTVMMCGYTGPPAWRRIGELATQVYALGLHQERKCANAPTWLAETRRRVFCAAYNQDKFISTFLGRPIRISKRHTDTKLPLDLADKEITGDQATLESAIQELDADGWNTKGSWLRASWIRLRHISLQFREEILEFSFVKIDANAQAQLLDISKRLHKSWETLPTHLRYWETCWEENTPPTISLMLITIHLTHWYNEFMIQKLLDSTPTMLNKALLHISIDLLSKSLKLGSIRDRRYDIHRDMLHCLLLFGLPAASVLATALRERHKTTGSSFPADISRPEIIRLLSVLIEYLEAAAHIENSGAGLGEADYSLCRKAAKVFVRVLHGVLGSGPAQEEEGIERTAEGQMAVDLGLDFDLFAGPGLDGLEGVELPGFGLGAAVNGNGNDAAVVDWGQWNVWGGPA
ncbi:hypothetical protein BDW02DRAFT_135954 [Decorospora gaudefroyi]|uniref:Zn(2)-C6 fungal-type domain-containing protein n=1 Tax=Decorospora gaudefroyi TaxID=184978 RepID=A0A6A5K4Q8_9PLEO|nr:hypothetical protein BDW02DRAFT_135954 [Decorospora gaudefroyi]